MDNKDVTKYIALSGSNTAYEFSVKNNYVFGGNSFFFETEKIVGRSAG